MFINTGGVPEQHRRHSRGKLHLQPQHHHHGHRHAQHFGQHHQAHWSRRLAARRRHLFPDPRHHGSLSAAALLLKPWTPRPPTPPTPHHPTQSNLTLLPFTALHRDHKTNMDGLHNLRCPP